jgi:hypothetical protein
LLKELLESYKSGHREPTDPWANLRVANKSRFWWKNQPYEFDHVTYNVEKTILDPPNVGFIASLCHLMGIRDTILLACLNTSEKERIAKQ